MKKLVLLAAVLFLMSLAGPAMAEGSVFGFFQTWLSYAAYSHPDSSDYDASQLAFGVRRARVGWKYKDGPFTGKFQGDGAGGTFKVLDAFGEYKINDMAKVRMGRFVGVGSQAGGLTSATKLDMIERSIVGRRWGSGTVGGDYRTYAAMVSLAPNELFTVKAQLGNGFGSVNAKPSSNSHNDNDPTDMNDDDPPTEDTGDNLLNDGFAPQIDFGVYAAPVEGLDLGFTYGLPNENLNTTGSMTAFAYYKTPAFYFKFDYATLQMNPDWDDDELDVNSMGYAVTGGYNVNDNAQFVARYEIWDADTDAGNDDGSYITKNVQFGLNYYFNPEAKYDQVLKLAFTRRMDEMPDDVDIADPNLVQIMWQIFMH